MPNHSPDHRIAQSPDSSRGLAAAIVLYTALTLVLTWPLARGLARDVPGDLGDPLFVMWVLAWGAAHLGGGLWNANIFYPHPLSLAYSEHFLPLAVAILPVYAVARNPVLCYNLVFLSTFILSGAGMFLLVRELTGSRPAGLLAGLAFMCAPYRFANLPHLQVLSSAWMPFVILGFRRYFATREARGGPAGARDGLHPDRRNRMALAGAGAAWGMQNLSCGY